MLWRCAPLTLAAGQSVRFVAATARFALRRVAGRRFPALNQQPAFRLRILGAFLRALPQALLDRRAVHRRAVVPRAAVSRQWLGVDPLVAAPAEPR